MTPEQQQQIRVAASLIAQRCIGLLGYPTVYSASEADGIQADLDKIKAVFYELDALKNDSASVPEERKAA
jgi:ferric iron reductase protein FhuF